MASEGKRPDWLADDDDGRTIADMRGVRRRNLWLPRRYQEESDLQDNDGRSDTERTDRAPNCVVEENGRIMDEAEANSFRPWEERDLDKKETRSLIFGATAAGLTLVAIFIIAGWLLICLLLWAWT